MKFDLSQVALSKSDIKRGVRLPTRLTTQLAEFIGIMIGDGHLGVYHDVGKYGVRFIHRDLQISCNKNENDYVSHICGLFYSIFNLNLKARKDRLNGILLDAHSKGILEFLNKICEVPTNNKSGIVTVPKLIKNTKIDFQYAFLRGLADTDFSVSFKNRTGKGHNYPVIKGSFKSKQLVSGLEHLLKSLNFTTCACYDQLSYDKRFGFTTEHSVYLNGKKNLIRWLRLIGFSNGKFQRKTEKWLADGICPPGY